MRASCRTRWLASTREFNARRIALIHRGVYDEVAREGCSRPGGQAHLFDARVLSLIEFGNTNISDSSRCRIEVLQNIRGMSYPFDHVRCICHVEESDGRIPYGL